jgi:L-lactate dehydrogenase (cytochrome)
VYLVGGREVAERGIRRAQDAGFSALVLTVDTPVAGMRERDLRNGTSALLSGNPIAMLPHVGQLLARPRWLLGFLRDGGLMQFPNVVLADGKPMKYETVGPALAQSVVIWRDLDWIRQIWRGPIVVKGILTGDDARRAADAGANAVIVSNHGGRQLDGVAASLRALPEVVAASGGHLDVLMDGGIRRGTDVVKAICLGAKAVLVGRAYAYGLGAAGRPGVARAIEILRADVVRTLALLGVESISGLDETLVDVR